MRIVLHGGFGEKGRTCVGVETGQFRLLLDAGVKTSARGREDYWPSITPAELAATDAILVTHGHEDHVAALGWCFDHGFRVHQSAADAVALGGHEWVEDAVQSRAIHADPIVAYLDEQFGGPDHL